MRYFHYEDTKVLLSVLRGSVCVSGGFLSGFLVALAWPQMRHDQGNESLSQLK
jgi:hypothetical protein